MKTPRHAIHGNRGPTILIAHGFKGFMGWGMFPWLADRLADAGFRAVRFDFSHNGADENGDFSRLDLFRQNTLSKEQEDLRAMVDATGAVGLLGHSRGGRGRDPLRADGSAHQGGRDARGLGRRRPDPGHPGASTSIRRGSSNRGEGVMAPI